MNEQRFDNLVLKHPWFCFAFYSCPSNLFNVPLNPVKYYLFRNSTSGCVISAGKMDLVDIDKVLDDLESLEETSTPRTVAPSAPSSRGYHLESPNRRIKVRSVLSSLNDYVDYDRKASDKPCTASGIMQSQ